MTDREKLYFAELTKKRTALANALDDPAASGIHDSIVEKYTDQAHFIYELLQNADDVKATSARFRLYPDKLVFTHNGSHHFSITDPSRERQDTISGKLGDMNAITSVGNSNKQKASIGKFGIGFKSVFQYTETPYIYEQNFRFKIERFIVPVELDADFPERREDETVFVFPFNHPKRSSEEAYEDISDKLRSLVYPTLFLKSLQEVSFVTNENSGKYEKHELAIHTFGDTVVQNIQLIKNDTSGSEISFLWLFTRKRNSFQYSVGFYVDSERGTLLPLKMPAFCFFQTKEVTDLNFIIHAPFLLTDNREGIKAGEKHNIQLIDWLAKLAADSLSFFRVLENKYNIRFIDDSILDIVPINEEAFAPLTDKSRVSFLPFFSELQNALLNGLLPTQEGYTSKDHAYWSDTLEISRLFTDQQLSLLLKEKDAVLVFRSYGRNAVGHNDRECLQKYIDSLTKGWINESTIYSNIDQEYIAEQEEAWLHSFYAWIDSIPKRFARIKSKPIFLNESGQPAAAYDKLGKMTLFLPSDVIHDCPTIKRSLLGNEKTVGFLENVVKITQPYLEDYIYNNIIPQYNRGTVTDVDQHFVLFFKHFCECKHEEASRFIDIIKSLPFISYTTKDSDLPRYDKASALYFPATELLQYFETLPDSKFIAYDKYEKLLDNDDSKKEMLISFLRELGIKNTVSVVETELAPSEAEKLPYEWHRSTGKAAWKELYPEGCPEILSFIVNNSSKEKSKLLWNTLVKLASESEDMSSVFSGLYEFLYYGKKQLPYVTALMTKLKTVSWLLDRNDSFVSPAAATAEDLNGAYDIDSDGARRLLSFLEIRTQSESGAYSDVDDHLTEDQRKDIALAKKIRAAGLDSNTDIDDLLKEIRRRKEKRASSDNSSKNYHIDELEALVNKNQKLQRLSDEYDENEEVDADDYYPYTVDYDEQIGEREEKNNAEEDRIKKMRALQSSAKEAEKYSYGWFMTLLQMEMLNSEEAYANKERLNITFNKIEHEAGTQKTYILRSAIEIPSFVENLSDIPLTLKLTATTTKTVMIDVSCIRANILKVKLLDKNDLEGIDLTKVMSASIRVTSPAFLLKVLYKAFKYLIFEWDYNLKYNLPRNIEFIYGPPGTGKTTYLANNILIPFMKGKEDLNVLVLTPTNKAADVITAKILESMGDDLSYHEWLVRYGSTGSEEIESNSIFCGKELYSEFYTRCLIITTIARFPYAYFSEIADEEAKEEDDDTYVRTIRDPFLEYEWDYIVIDEASMVSLADIIFPLYYCNPRKFIIAGDPYQIEPITTVKQWENENIYSMVNLRSFKEPTTEPEDFKVTTLTTQYRSVPEIGELFSKFTYDGILQHYRNSTSKRALNLDTVLDIEALNIIKFPVSDSDSIYKAKRLSGTTPYHIYSALFTMELVSFIARNLAANNPNESFTIGIISPYKAQANLVNKLLLNEDIPPCINIISNTIHSFQGDECDIVFALLNPPPNISSSKKLFLNKQNILNVAISRARDYLFVIMPDDSTENSQKLRAVKTIEKHIKSNNSYMEYSAAELEKIMFGSETHIEDNAFVTAHQAINIYARPEKKYDIRSDDTAIDVQLKK